jgi:hypothetical protein
MNPQAAVSLRHHQNIRFTGRAAIIRARQILLSLRHLTIPDGWQVDWRRMLANAKGDSRILNELS